MSTVHAPAGGEQAAARRAMGRCARWEHGQRSRRPLPPQVLHRAAEVPPAVIDVFLVEMAERLSRTPEARACVGLSFAFITSDVAVRPARYEVRSGGIVAVSRAAGRPATFTFLADAETFDNVLRGRRSALLALLQRHIRCDGSFSRIRALLCMLPALQQAYAATRSQVIARNRQRYVFAF